MSNDATDEPRPTPAEHDQPAEGGDLPEIDDGAEHASANPSTRRDDADSGG